MLFITPNIRETVNSLTDKTKLFLRFPKLVTRTRDEIILCHLKMLKLVQLEEENLDLSTADLDQFKIHQVTITQTKLI